VNGEPAGRLLLDVWHVERGQIALADVAALAPEAIGHVEIDDAAAQIHGSLWEDTVDHRLLCGQGDLDIDGFLAAVRSTGYTGTYGVEIISAAHRNRSLQDAISAAYTTTVAALVRAPSGNPKQPNE
jgi:sugar phosphate isomerase/epimerase